MLYKGKGGLSHIYVIGCGPSLKNFDWSLLKHKTTIAVNGAIYDTPKPDYFITGDSSFAVIAITKVFKEDNLFNVDNYQDNKQNG